MKCNCCGGNRTNSEGLVDTLPHLKCALERSLKEISNYRHSATEIQRIHIVFDKSLIEKIITVIDHLDEHYKDGKHVKSRVLDKDLGFKIRDVIEHLGEYYVHSMGVM